MNTKLRFAQLYLRLQSQKSIRQEVITAYNTERTYHEPPPRA